MSDDNTSEREREFTPPGPDGTTEIPAGPAGDRGRDDEPGTQGTTEIPAGPTTEGTTEIPAKPVEGGNPGGGQSGP